MSTRPWRYTRKPEPGKTMGKVWRVVVAEPGPSAVAPSRLQTIHTLGTVYRENGWWTADPPNHTFVWGGCGSRDQAASVLFEEWLAVNRAIYLRILEARGQRKAAG